VTFHKKIILLVSSVMIFMGMQSWLEFISLVVITYRALQQILAFSETLNVNQSEQKRSKSSTVDPYSKLEKEMILGLNHFKEDNASFETLFQMPDISNSVVSFCGVKASCRLAVTSFEIRVSIYQAHPGWNFLYKHRFSRLCSLDSFAEMERLTYRRTHYKQSFLKLRRLGQLLMNLQHPAFRSRVEEAWPSAQKSPKVLQLVGLCQNSRPSCRQPAKVVCAYEGCHRALCSDHAKRAQRLWRGAPGAIYAQCSYCLASVCERHSCPQGGQPQLKIWSCGTCGISTCSVCSTEVLFNCRLEPPNENARCYRCTDTLCKNCAIPYEELGENAFLCTGCEEKYLAPKNGPEEFWVRDDDVLSNSDRFQFVEQEYLHLDIPPMDLRRNVRDGEHGSTNDANAHQILLSLLVSILESSVEAKESATVPSL